MTDSALSTVGTIVGVDVGGTFTDLIALDPEHGLRLSKVPSTLDNQAKGVLSAIEAAGCKPSELNLIVHGTTTTTNAVLERKLAKTGLITTQGFRDVLELGRRTRPQAYGMFGTFEPIIPRDLRFEVPERMDCSGTVLTPLDQTAVKAAAQALLQLECDSIIVHFLHSYANPKHELEALDVLRQQWPNNYITAGHMLLSESREYERGVTAAVNASVQPILDKYISSLTSQLITDGYQGDLLVMSGNGGMVNAQDVAKEAAKTVMSGPASGVMAAAFTARSTGFKNLITYDMGGTSTDVALVRNATPSVSNEIEVEYGMPIHVPMVDVRTVGAGGGSIAHITAGGLLEIGPESAGAAPGPICYGRGGTKPTISDANMLLGRLDPSGLSASKAGTLEQVQDTFRKTLCPALNLDVIQAAAAVIEVANTKMAGAIRMVSLSLGADPRDFALFAFGGAGPLHASALARELGIPQVIIPARPGLTNALGCLVADLRRDYVQTINTPLTQMPEGQLARQFAKLASKGNDAIVAEHIALDGRDVLYSLDMQFIGQTHLLRVPISDPDISTTDLQTLFEAAYFERFHVTLPNIEATIVNVNCSVIGRRQAIDLKLLFNPSNRKTTLADALSNTRRVFWDGVWHDTPVYDREALPIGAQFTGPAVISQMDTTVLISQYDAVTVDDVGNLLISVGGAA